VAGRIGRRARSARAAIVGWINGVWASDLTAMCGWQLLRCRVLRLLTWTVAGFVRHTLSRRAIALTYYTMFSIIPLLAVVLWGVKVFDWIPDVGSDPAQSPIRAFLRDNAQLAKALAAILRAVRRLDLTGGGLVGLVALLYAVARLFFHIEGTVDTIAAARKRPLRIGRLLGYVVLLAMPAVLTVGAGVVSAWLVAPLRGVVSSAVGGIATIDLVMGIVVAAAAIALVLAVLYVAAARAQVPFASAALGGAVGACLLLATMWVFATFQIGVSRRDGVTSGVAAIPVLFMWTYTSWLMVLIGAEIAVGHAVGRIVNHGVAVLIPDAATRPIIGALVMAELARAPPSDATSGGRRVGADAMARQLRVLPQAVRTIADRLVRRGLLEHNSDGYAIRGDANHVYLSDVVDAMARDPERADGRAELLDQLGPDGRAALATVAGVRTITSGDMTLRQLADGAFPGRAAAESALASGAPRARLVERQGES
jgi:membrane protein